MRGIAIWLLLPHCELAPFLPMQDDLYPPGMAPPGKKPAAAPARERKAVAGPAKVRQPLPKASPQSDLDPPAPGDSVPDFSEILPDDVLPPMAEATSLPM